MKNKINRYILILGIILCLCDPASAEVIDRIIAIVNNDIITLVELNKETTVYVNKIKAAGYPIEKQDEMIKEVNKKILQGLIDRSLTQQEAKRYFIEISDTEVDAAVEDVKKSKNLSQDELEKALIKEGMTLEELKENLGQQILQARLINNAVKSKVAITQSDKKAYYEENATIYAGTKKYHLRNILMKDETKIKEVKQKLDKKEIFVSLAKKYSIAPNASDGGDLGLFNIENFSEEIKNSISKLKKGDYTDVTVTPQGFQIFYVEDIVLDGHKTFLEAEEEIHGDLYKKEVELKFKTWLKSLKEKAHIKIML